MGVREPSWLSKQSLRGYLSAVDGEFPPVTPRWLRKSGTSYEITNSIDEILRFVLDSNGEFVPEDAEYRDDALEGLIEAMLEVHRQTNNSQINVYIQGTEGKGKYWHALVETSDGEGYTRERMEDADTSGLLRRPREEKETLGGRRILRGLVKSFYSEKRPGIYIAVEKEPSHEAHQSHAA